MSKIILIGGSNVDFIATSDSPIIEKTSNIGKISISHGGVMRNVCQNLATLNNECIFFTCLGNDSFGKSIKEELDSLKVTTLFPFTNLPTSKYVVINDSNHDIKEAICDNRVIDELNINFIKKHIEIFNESNYIFLDSNLNEEFIHDLYDLFPNKKICFDAISRQKVRKFKDLLLKTYLIKCNIYEAQELVGENIDNDELLDKFISLGVKSIIISRGSSSILYLDNFQKGEIKIKKVDNFINTTGCGDALFSGIIDKLCENKSLKESIEFGIKLSLLTLQDEKACSEKIKIYSK